MYREEKVIDGVLSYRTSPNSEWVAFSQEELTEKILKLQEEVRDLDNQLEEKVQGE